MWREKEKRLLDFLLLKWFAFLRRRWIFVRLLMQPYVVFQENL
jgi:hypothetical protein